MDILRDVLTAPFGLLGLGIGGAGLAGLLAWPFLARAERKRWERSIANWEQEVAAWQPGVLQLRRAYRYPRCERITWGYDSTVAPYGPAEGPIDLMYCEKG